MNQLNATLQLFFVLIWTFASSQYTSIINSNRPGLTQGAYSVGPGVYQLEFGSSYRQDNFISLAQAKSQGAGFALDLRTGLILQNLEIIYRANYQIDRLTYNHISGQANYKRKGTKLNTFGFKFLLFDPFRNNNIYKTLFRALKGKKAKADIAKRNISEPGKFSPTYTDYPEWFLPNNKSYKSNKGLRLIDLVPAVSIYFGSEFSFGNIYPYGEPFLPIFNLKATELNQDEISGELILITQNHFLNNFVFVTNWGRRYLGSANEQNYMSSSLMIPIKKRLMGFVEQVSVKSKLSSDFFLNFGAVYLINENIQVDGFISDNFKQTPATFSAGVGISFRIDRYNDSGIPYEIKELRKKRKKNRFDRKINDKKIKEFKDRERQKRREERKQKKQQKK